MNWFNHIRYFFYIAFNWNVRIAYYILKQEIRGERRYRIRTTGADELKSLEKKGIEIGHATIYMPVSYDILETLFDEAAIHNKKHFIDIGCGKGRAISVAAAKGCPKVTGIDFSKAFCEAAKKNMERVKTYQQDVTYSVINNDAFYYDIPDDADCLFFFNPFDEVIMSGVVQRIRESLRRRPRALTVIYVNPLHKEAFLKAGFRESFYCTKLKYLEGVLLNYQP